MADPVTTARLAPDGFAIPDGFSTKIAFSLDANIEFFEKTVTPPGMDGGDMVDQTTMHNLVFRTMLPRSLITMTESSTTCAYDAKVLDSIIALINKEGDVTIHFPNGDTWDFYGVLRQFTPQEHSEGAQPEAEVLISPTNWDPDLLVENGPNFITAVGTD